MRFINELAVKKSALYVKLMNQSPPVIEHLLKIFYHRDHADTVFFWEKELYKFFHKVVLLKENKKFPSRNFLMDALWFSSSDLFDSRDHQEYVDDINEDCATDFGYIGKLSPNAKGFCHDYMDWISGELSVNGTVSKEDIINEVEHLLTEYRR